MDEALNYRKRPLMVREYRWYANVADIEFRSRLDATALLIRASIHESRHADGLDAVGTLDYIREYVLPGQGEWKEWVKYCRMLVASKRAGYCQNQY